MAELRKVDAEFLTELLVGRPLYTRQKALIPQHATGLVLDKLLTHCPECKIERPFRDTRPSGSGAGMAIPETKSGVYGFVFWCAECGQRLSYWIEVNVEDGWLRKVGQVPPWSVAVSSELERALGEDVELYKNGLLNLSQGYGLGACAYLRRAVENKINRILELLLELNREAESSPGQISELETLLASKIADKKLAEASKYLPKSLIVNGVNPLRLLYESFSEGLHSLTDDECVSTGLELKASFEYVLLEMSQQLSRRERFAAEVRRIAKKRQRKCK